MKVRGTQTIRETVDVEISNRELFDTIEKNLKQKWKIGRGWYINSRTNNWEDWTDTGHGSGLTDVERAAEAHEIEAMNALSVLREQFKDV